MHIFLIRHGSTAWNREKIFRGHLDIPIDEGGKNQADATGRYLRKIKLSIIYSSPLKRAFQTARAVRRHQEEDVKVAARQGFVDLNYGEWEGVSYQEIKRNYQELYRIWEKEPDRIRIPKGETLKEAAERSWRAMQQVIFKHHRFVGIVSHRVINKLLICRMLGIGEAGFWKIKQDTCCVNLIEYHDGKFTVLRLNDTSHIFSVEKILESFDF